MISMCSLEDTLFRQHRYFSTSCIPCAGLQCPASWSLGGYVALLNNKPGCKDIDNTDVGNTKAMLVTCVPYYLDGSLQEHCSLTPGACPGVPAVCIAHDVAYVILHFLTESKFAKDLAADPNAAILNLAVTILPMSSTDLASVGIYLENIHGKTSGDANVVLKGLYFDVKFELFGAFMLGDTLYFLIGTALVVFLIWVYTGSILVMLAAVINIAMSLLLGYFVYTAVFQREFFPFVNVAAAILIIGIGADDTFVYMDLWRKFLAANPDNKNLVWVVKDTIYHATSTMFVTSFTTTCALYTSMMSDITAVKGFALFSGTTILVNFALTVTWLPAIIITQHRLMIWCCGGGGGTDGNKSDTASVYGKLQKGVAVLFSPMRYLTYELIPLVVLKLRFLWVALFGSLGIAFIIVTFVKPGLQLPSKAEFQLLRPSNLFEQYDLVFKHRFSFESDNKSPMTGILVFGTKPVDLGDPWNPRERGKLVLDEAFSIYEAESQAWLLDFCVDLRNQSFCHVNERFFCFFDLFVQLMSFPCVNPFTGVDSTPCCNVTPFPYPAPIMEACLKIVTTQVCAANGGCDNTFPGPRFSTEDDHLAALYMVFESTYHLSFDYGTMLRYWDSVNAFLVRKLKTAPPSLKSGWFASFNYPQLYFFDLQHGLARGIPITLAVTMVISIVILVVSILNVVLALFTILSIAFTIFTTIGSLVLLGWQLNIFESVIITLSVGLSVDFTIHYAVAYNMAPHQAATREERTRESMRTMCGAISIAAASTFVAGAMMLPANVYVYVQLGTFLVLVMAISWTYATFFFLSLCAVFGPQGTFGQIPLPCGGKQNRVADIVD